MLHDSCCQISIEDFNLIVSDRARTCTPCNFFFDFSFSVTIWLWLTFRADFDWLNFRFKPWQKLGSIHLLINFCTVYHYIISFFLYVLSCTTAVFQVYMNLAYFQPMLWLFILMLDKIDSEVLWCILKCSCWIISLFELNSRVLEWILNL